MFFTIFFIKFFIKVLFAIWEYYKNAKKRDLKKFKELKDEENSTANRLG